jgi:hypothetical protein
MLCLSLNVVHSIMGIGIGTFVQAQCIGTNQINATRLVQSSSI